MDSYGVSREVEQPKTVRGRRLKLVVEAREVSDRLGRLQDAFRVLSWPAERTLREAAVLLLTLANELPVPKERPRGGRP